MSGHDALRERLLGLLEKASVQGELPPVTPQTHLLRAGVLDSLGVVDLAAAIEGAWNIRLPRGAVNPANFSTLQSIENMIAEHGGPKP
ncbi:acyl carrier protein [Ramlibacter sp.]|uniref:acyl carrier protein n=1 Tax=Ramlibacter sp. TaxID=1917967 RepID=UPI0017FA8B44|nr:acyl carrier protein [Ramlibacter sp.]MBA2676730.1 acyl carrier protein [Ramlibacter sp.]